MAQEPPCQRQALERRKIMRRARSKKNRPILLAVNTQHVHPRLGGRTPAQHRRGLRPRKLPASFVVPTERLPLAAGHVTFIRRVRTAGTVTVLSQSFWVRKRHSGLYLRW
jgi:hypothetical protein